MGPIVVKIVVPFMFFPIAFYLMFKSAPGKLTLPRPKMMLKMVKYSVPMGLSSMLGSISLQLDKMIVSSMRSPEEYAVYANGAVEIPLISIITGSISAVILVDMRKHAIKKEYKDAMALFNKASLKSASILFPAMCFFMLMGPEFIEVLFSSRYVESALPFRVYLLRLPARIVVFGAALMAIGKSMAILYRVLIGLFLNGAISILLVHLLGAIGAALATLLLLFTYTIPFNLYHISKGYGVSIQRIFNFKKLIFIFLCATFTLLPILPIKLFISNSFLALTTSFAIYSLLFLGIIVKFSLPIKDDLVRIAQKVTRGF